MTTLVPERRKGNLPAEVTSFIGRRRELSVAEAIAVARNAVPVPADEISAELLTSGSARSPSW